MSFQIRPQRLADQIPNGPPLSFRLPFGVFPEFIVDQNMSPGAWAFDCGLSWALCVGSLLFPPRDKLFENLGFILC